MTIAYDFGDALYLNITNRCPCDCNFCLRREGEGVNSGQSLWLDHEPSLDEIKQALDAVDYNRYTEVVFCGYGEPCERLDILLSTAQYIKDKTTLPIRLNTNGLSDLINKDLVEKAEKNSTNDASSTAKLLAKCIDRISISLNAPDAETYNALCHPDFEDSFNALIAFAKECKHEFKEVTLSVVAHSLDKEAVERCRALCSELGLPLRLR